MPNQPDFLLVCLSSDYLDVDRNWTGDPPVVDQSPVLVPTVLAALLATDGVFLARCLRAIAVG